MKLAATVLAGEPAGSDPLISTPPKPDAVPAISNIAAVADADEIDSVPDAMTSGPVMMVEVPVTAIPAPTVAPPPVSLKPLPIVVRPLLFTCSMTKRLHKRG